MRRFKTPGALLLANLALAACQSASVPESTTAATAWRQQTETESFLDGGILYWLLISLTERTML